jgi:purine-nucleoside phosphorylase
LYFGSCGAISPKVAIGDVILPDGAVVDEGTSPHYAPAIAGKTVLPSQGIVDVVRGELASTADLTFKEGPVWTTDAIYRETRGKVARFQAAGVLGVEMELSALWTVAHYRGAEAAGLLVASDELSDFTWKPGFKDDRFIQGRAAAIEVIDAVCRRMAGPWEDRKVT